MCSLSKWLHVWWLLYFYLSLSWVFIIWSELLYNKSYQLLYYAFIRYHWIDQFSWAQTFDFAFLPYWHCDCSDRWQVICSISQSNHSLLVLLAISWIHDIYDPSNTNSFFLYKLVCWGNTKISHMQDLKNKNTHDYQINVLVSIWIDYKWKSVIPQIDVLKRERALERELFIFKFLA